MLPVAITDQAVERIEKLVETTNGAISRAALIRALVMHGLDAAETDLGAVLFNAKSAPNGYRQPLRVNRKSKGEEQSTSAEPAEPSGDHGGFCRTSERPPLADVDGQSATADRTSADS